MLVMTPTSGSAMRASSRIWPSPRIAISTTTTSVVSSSSSSVSGTPISLLRLARGRHDAGHRAQQRREDVLGGGLAGAAGDADDPGARPPPDGARQAAQSGAPVVDDDARRGRRQPRRGLGAHDDRGGAGLERLRGVRVAVEALAAQADEQVAAAQRACVGADARDGGLRVATLEAAAAGGRDLGRGSAASRLSPPRAGRRAPLRRPRGRRRGSRGRRSSGPARDPCRR